MRCLTMPTSAECYGFRTALLARYVIAIYDSVLADQNISSARLHVMILLYERPERTATELGDALHADLSTILHLLRTLKKQTLIRYGTPRPRGQKTYRLTRQGKARLSACTYDWQRAQQRMREVIGNDLLAALVERVPTVQTIAPRPERKRHRPIHFYDYAEEANDFFE
jgi:DNA-binding MarR family transcriptional regulator